MIAPAAIRFADCWKDEATRSTPPRAGPEALELVASRPYALAVLDYQMPGMNGVELYQKIREVRGDVAAIFLTAFTTLDTVYPAIAAGAERILAKPVRSDELFPLVDAMVGRESEKRSSC